MFTTKATLHSAASKEDLEQIISLKSVAWPYPVERQKKWMEDNLKGNDIHFLLLDDGNPVAYLNLVDTELSIDGISLPALGVGNVCSGEKGKGYGKELMLRTNDYILDTNKVGLLFCKDELVAFYQLCNWKLIEQSDIVLPEPNNLIRSMIINYNQPYHLIKYTNLLF